MGEHLSAVARGILYRPCGASLSERWHCLQWLPEASRKQTVVLFSSSYNLHERAVGSKKHHCLLTHTHTQKNVFLHSVLGYDSQLWIIVYSSSWSLLWSNINNVPTLYFTWSKGMYTHTLFWPFFFSSGDVIAFQAIGRVWKKRSQSEMCIISNTRASECHRKEFCIFLHVCMKADRECLLWTGKNTRNYS